MVVHVAGHVDHVHADHAGAHRRPVRGHGQRGHHGRRRDVELAPGRFREGGQDARLSAAEERPRVEREREAAREAWVHDGALPAQGRHGSVLADAGASAGGSIGGAGARPRRRVAGALAAVGRSPGRGRRDPVRVRVAVEEGGEGQREAGGLRGAEEARGGRAHGVAKQVPGPGQAVPAYEVQDVRPQREEAEELWGLVQRVYQRGVNLLAAEDGVAKPAPHRGGEVQVRERGGLLDGHHGGLGVGLGEAQAEGASPGLEVDCREFSCRSARRRVQARQLRRDGCPGQGALGAALWRRGLLCRVARPHPQPARWQVA
mmetsp:Transcript_15452/g.58526  ORF Transcript_15452/g.58526 Transcript_15452/m.58526 type:complete len:317 (+) Transcript_15452:990-1940(+)